MKTRSHSLTIQRHYSNGTSDSQTIIFDTRDEMLAQIEHETRPVNQPAGTEEIVFRVVAVW